MTSKNCQHPDWDWSAVVFTARESPATVQATIRSIAAAAFGHPRTVLDVLVNGNEPTARALTAWIEKEEKTFDCSIRVWLFEQADKASAFNQYFEFIWPGSELAFFVDGYVRVQSDSFSLLAELSQSRPHANVFSAVPSVGRSAAALRSAMLTEGGIAGNLFAIRGASLRDMRQRKFRLPYGLYRTDPTIAAAICFDLDPPTKGWNAKRIAVHPDATWTFDALRAGSYASLRSHWKRMSRQALGDFENAAVREHFALSRKKIEDLPGTASDLILGWIDRNPWKSMVLVVRNPLRGFAIYHLMRTDMTLKLSASRPQILFDSTRHEPKPLSSPLVNQAAEKMNLSRHTLR